MFEFVFLLTPARTPQAVTFVLKNMFFGTFSKYMKGTSQNGWSCFHGARDHRDFGFQPVQPKPFRPTWMTDEREVTTYWLQKKYRRQARVVWAWAHGKFSRARGAVPACTAYVLFFSWAQSKGGKRRTKHAMESKKKNSEKFSQKGIKTKRSKEKMFIEINKQSCGTYSIGKCTAPNKKEEQRNTTLAKQRKMKNQKIRPMPFLWKQIKGERQRGRERNMSRP